MNRVRKIVVLVVTVPAAVAVAVSVSVSISIAVAQQNAPENPPIALFEQWFEQVSNHNGDPMTSWER